MSFRAGFCSAAAGLTLVRDMRPKIAQYALGTIDLDRTLERVRDGGVHKQSKGRELANAL